MSDLALHGGPPVRTTLLPYGRQNVSEEDIAAVAQVLRSDWLTTGPKVREFEDAFAEFCRTKEAVAVNSGTAALHAAMFALEIGPGDEVVVPGMTFAATANAVMFQGGTPVFVDVLPDTLNIDPAKIESAINPRTKAIIAVDYAGQPCDYNVLNALATKHGLPIIADACHALGGSDHGKSVGSLTDMSTFSFHPVKPMTTGEGGMITTDDPDHAKRMRRFRNHCLTSEHRERHEGRSWYYEMPELGYNYRLTDFQCALGISQLRKVLDWNERRRRIAARYDGAFAQLPAKPLARRPDAIHAYHLYVILLDPQRLRATRKEIFQALCAENIGVNVHYVPPHLHPFYRNRFGIQPGLCPVAEDSYERMLTLPLFSSMSDQDAEDVMAAVTKVLSHYAA
jgi:perosamine synthetase